MTFFDMLNMVGGLALFLYGMTALGDGLAKMSGGKLERLLERLTSNRFMAVILGAGVTAVIQSSSATTVMVVGFVNSGIMKLSQAVGIIMGANIGTTITAWILSLNSIQSDSFFVRLLNPSSFSPVLAIVGVILIMMSKKENHRDIGSIFIGFAVLMFGMNAMSDAVEPLSEMESFRNILLMFSNPFMGMLAGAVLTAVIQSSSASVGILQAFCMTGAINYSAAIPIIMGQNIGTCITAIISAVGASKNAKRAAAVHLYFNIIGTFAFMIVFYIINSIIHFEFLESAASAASIAVIHSAFNVAATFLLLPFANQLEKLAYFTVRDESEKKKNQGTKKYSHDSLLDDRFLDKPGFALELCRRETVRMAEMSKEAIYNAIDVAENYDKNVFDHVVSMEQRIDKFEDDLGTYLVKLSGSTMSQADSRTQSILMHCIGDFERISDHAVNLLDAAEEMKHKNLKFSSEATEELAIMMEAVKKIVRRSMGVFIDMDVDRARKVEPLEQVIDNLAVEIRQRHIHRLKEGKCTIELGFILSDMITVLERVADHCSNIAVCIIKVNEDEFDTHKYLDIIKNESNEEFNEKFNKYQERYKLPNVDYFGDEEEATE
ncbi:MAG: Na/Pi cotransporter family protein [Firmicutes bacterium]|nr:Na/Pi cotransporter family protein [Bacillota bacterium]